MLFNSLTFVVFFVVVVSLFWGIRSWTARKNFLVTASYIFYGAWNPPFAALLFATTALDFYLGRKMGKLHEPRERRLWLIISVAVNLSMLGFFKYGNFLLENFQWVLARGGIQDAANSALPRKGHSVVDRLERNFELEDDAIDGFQQVSGSVDIGRLQFVVCALHHENAVLSVGLDENRSHPAGHAIHLLYVSGIDAELLEILDGRRTKEVAADSGHHEDRSSAQPGCGRLIGALASESEVELLAENRFAGLGKAVSEGG